MQQPNDTFREYFGGKLVHYVIHDDYQRKQVERKGFVAPGDERFEYGSSYKHLWGHWYKRNE